MRKQIVEAASTQNDFDSLVLESMQQTFSMIVIFIRFATPFCSIVPITIWCLIMPSDLHKALNSLEQNSKPLSMERHFIRYLIKIFHSLNVAKTSLLFFKKNDQALLEKSSIIVNI